MMFQVGVFPYARMEDIGSYAVELPYGNVRILIIQVFSNKVLMFLG